MVMKGEPHAIAVVGTYPPTRCGIATFTSSLGHALNERYPTSIVRLVEDGDGVAADEGLGIVANWTRGDEVSRGHVLAALECFAVVVVQHEFGVFGGPDGDEIVTFLEECPIPSVVVLHTAPAEPTPNQRRILDSIGKLASVVVVQSNAALDCIVATTSIDPDVMHVIAHGAVLNLTGPADRLSQQPVVLTWGLLWPGKGIEHGIDAMAGLQDLVPRPVYAVVGETHPKIREREGEAYRKSLIAQAARLGIANQVIFDGSYRDTASLLRVIRGADVLLLPYDSTEQVTSGVLVEAIASGKPVVATAFPHAVELLSDGPGLVVDHGDARAMAAALRRILTSSPCGRPCKIWRRNKPSTSLGPLSPNATSSLFARSFERRQPMSSPIRLTVAEYPREKEV
jgi:polysaccharide biosynthesis protein PslF